MLEDCNIFSTGITKVSEYLARNLTKKESGRAVKI